MPARTRGHAFLLPGSSKGAGQLEGEKQNRKPKPQGFSYKLVGFEKDKEIPEEPLGLKWLF